MTGKARWLKRLLVVAVMVGVAAVVAAAMVFVFLNTLDVSGN